MTWEQKTEMISLFNQGKQKEAQDFVEPFLEVMDVQAKDMLFTALELTDENIAANKPFFEKLKNVMSISIPDVGMRTAIRIEYFKLLMQ